MALTQKENIEAIKKDRTNIPKFSTNGRMFAKKELGLTEEVVDETGIEEDTLAEISCELDQD